MTNSNDNQEWSRFTLKMKKADAQSFRVALALNDETAQDALYRLALEYCEKTPLPNGLCVGKSVQ